MSRLSRLLSEIRPTFLPYARITVRTRLSPEQCRERLVPATQPQKIPALFSASTSQDTRYLFKGQVSRTGFLVAPIDQRPTRQRRRDAKPFLVAGHFKPEFGGTDIIVQVFPDPFGFVLVLCMFCFYVAQMLFAWSCFGFERPVLLLVSLMLLLFSYAALAFPVSFEAFQSKRTLEKLFR